ncbi:plasmid pRiA4b ORF-3 family protein [uncultured Bacteroides sp.]|uniref:plasmid pRiA4b ORF-3 family protein n=1 Tax=uncultured Bacteroides sp. TaxID=162156 RepID=UPI00280A74C3|nr:plasmid pRiA4b ORF-3 family protein [uncultured Bacteroides sp.]
MEKIYKRYEIPTILVKGGIKELKKEMPHAEQSESLDFETIEDLIGVVYNDEWDDENFDEDFDDEFDEDFDDEFDDEDSFYIETITPKKLKLKITLTDSSPEVWRTLEVPSNIRLESFAEVIEVAMGWEGYHLHLFRKGKNIYLPDYEKDDNFLREDKIEKSSSATSLGEVLPKKGSRIEYEYDFGDSWMHTITLESQEAYKKDDIRSIILIDGANACPPEDCGGIWGYRRILEALEHPRTKAAREYREWLGKDFNPQKFNIKKAKKEMNDFPIAISE